MEAYSSSYATSKSSYLSQNNPDEAKGLKNAYSFQSHDSLLHSVRKKSSQSKPWKKAPVAPPPPTPIRVYEVDVMNFREVVQQLTGAPEFNPHQLHDQFVQDVAPTAAITPPQNTMLSAAAAPPSAVSTNWYQQGEQLGVKSQENSPPGLLELNLSSPSSYSPWCSSLP